MRKGREVLHIAWRREELQSECLFCVVLFSLEHLYEGFVVELSLLNGCFFPRLFDLVVGEVVTTSLQKLLQAVRGQQIFVLLDWNFSVLVDLVHKIDFIWFIYFSCLHMR